MMRIRWLHEARLEARESIHYYRSKAPELGPALTDEIRARIAFAVRFPEAGVRLASTNDVHVRRLLLDRFEYAVVLALLEDELVVVAVHHQHRKPGYWKPRLAKVRP